MIVLASAGGAIGGCRGGSGHGLGRWRLLLVLAWGVWCGGIGGFVLVTGEFCLVWIDVEEGLGGRNDLLRLFRWVVVPVKVLAEVMTGLVGGASDDAVGHPAACCCSCCCNVCVVKPMCADFVC